MTNKNLFYSHLVTIRGFRVSIVIIDSIDFVVLFLKILTSVHQIHLCVSSCVSTQKGAISVIVLKATNLSALPNVKVLWQK